MFENVRMFWKKRKAKADVTPQVMPTGKQILKKAFSKIQVE